MRIVWHISKLWRQRSIRLSSETRPWWSGGQVLWAFCLWCPVLQMMTSSVDGAAIIPCTSCSSWCSANTMEYGNSQRAERKWRGWRTPVFRARSQSVAVIRRRSAQMPLIICPGHEIFSRSCSCASLRTRRATCSAVQPQLSDKGEAQAGNWRSGAHRIASA